MKLKLASAVAAGLLVLAGVGSSPAGAVTGVVNFETNPSIPQGPSIYVAVPAQQTIVAPEATFTGGVVLGFATFFPAISFATVPNVYGTADFGNNLARTLTIDVNPNFTTTQVSFALFNGETFAQTYLVNAFNGLNVVASQTLLNMAPNFNSGFGIVDLSNAAGITSVVIAPTGNPAAFDFLIDTVAFNQSITNVLPNIPPPPPPVDITQPIVPITPPVQGHRHGKKQGETELVEINFGDDINDIRGSVLVITPVPEPSTWLMMLLGVGWVGSMATRRSHKSAGGVAA